MRSTAAAALGALLLAGCAVPRDPLEEAARFPAPLLRADFGDGAPAALPSSAGAADARILGEALRRGSLTLADCIGLAEAHDEDLLSGDEARLQARLQGDLARAAAIGDLRLLARHDRQDPVSGSSTAPQRSQLALGAVQPLFAGMREWNAAKSAERVAGALEAERENLRRLLALSVSRAFFSVAEAEAEMRAEEEAIGLADERIRETGARVEQGLARRTEVLLQESRRETTRALLLETRERRDRARLVLQGLAGAPLELPLDVGSAPAVPLPDRSGALFAARDRRPDLRAADLRVQAAEADVDVAKGQRWPVVQASGDAYLARDNYSSSTRDVRWDMAITMDFPIFLGGEIDAKERIASSRLRQAELARSRTLRAVAVEVQDALLRFEAGHSRLDTLRANEKFARENLDLLRAEYRQGLATNLEVFTAQIQLQEAAVALERQDHLTRLDRIEVLLATGPWDPAPAGTAPAVPAKEKP